MPNGYNWNGGSQNPMGIYGQIQVPSNMMGQAAMQNTQPIRPSYIPGKMIASLNDITPQEVPMDGSAALFPANDLSCIYLKAWGSDGLIKTFKFVPEPDNSAQKSPEGNFQETILERLDSIEELVKKNSYRKPYYKRNNQNGTKKEEMNDAES